MGQSDSEQAVALASGERTASKGFRTCFIPLIATTSALLLSYMVYQHLIRQAMSQGFVLQELRPLMDWLTASGEYLYRLGGRPLFSPAVLMLGAVCCGLTLSSVQKENPFLYYRRLIVLAISFFLMYLIGGTRSFPLYVAGMIAIPVIGYLGESNAGELASPAPAKIGEKAIAAAILLLGLLLRLYQVDVFPRLYSADEQLLAQVTLDLGEHPLRFFAEPHIMKPHLLRIAGMRIAFSLLGVGLFQHRTVSVIVGTVTIFLVYLLCRMLWGNRAGLSAAFLLAIDPWHIGHSRSGVHNVDGPLFLMLLMLLIIRAVRSGGIRNFIVVGLAAGAAAYLYISCIIMAPFAWAAVLLGRYVSAKGDKKIILREAGAMIAASILIALPYFTFGRKNIGQLEDFYSQGHFLASAHEHEWNPAFTAFANFWNGIEYVINWSPRIAHPAATFYPNPIIIGLALVGFGVLLKMRKKFEHMLILIWIPLSFLPMTLSYGFAERRLFATFSPIPALLSGLALARLSEILAGRSATLNRRLHQLLAIMLLASLTLVSLFIVFKDADPISGGCPHPRKVAEFIGSLPPQYTVLISNQVKDNPFLVYLQSYNRLKEDNRRQAFSFVPIEALAGMAQKIAATPGVAVVTDPGPQELILFEKIKTLNPEVEVIKADQFWACLVQ